MYRVTFILILLTVGLVACSTVRGESLELVGEVSYAIDRPEYIYDYSHGTITALLLGGDTIISASGAGLWAQFVHDQPWRKLMEGPLGCTGDTDYSEQKKWTGQLPCSVGGMLRAATTEIVLLVNEELRALSIRDGTASFVEVLDVPRGRGNSGSDYALSSVVVAGEFLVCGRYCWSEEPMMVVLQPTDRDRGSEYRRIFPVSAAVKERLHSVYIYTPSSLTTFDPQSNTIWVAIWGYEQIYVIDMEGAILDSVHIAQADYIDPGPPKSWMRTQAVRRDWRSKWTPVQGFKYVAPGYFVLQYRVGSEVMGNDTVPLYGTAVWDTDRQPVDLEVDKHWQLAGVQPDGRAIFAHHDIEGDERRIVLNITRIVP